VREAWLGVLEKRYRAEKRLLKTAIVMTKDLNRIILDYSRIDAKLLQPLESEEIFYGSRYPEINDSETGMSIRISRIAVDPYYQRSHDHVCLCDMFIMVHIDTHIRNECYLMCISIASLFDYILIGELYVIPMNHILMDTESYNNYVYDFVDNTIMQLYNLIIWPICQKMPMNLSYSGYELCDHER
jgi:hypothetical protein